MKELIEKMNRLSVDKQKLQETHNNSLGLPDNTTEYNEISEGISEIIDEIMENAAEHIFVELGQELFSQYGITNSDLRDLKTLFYEFINEYDETDAYQDFVVELTNIAEIIQRKQARR